METDKPASASSNKLKSQAGKKRKPKPTTEDLTNTDKPETKRAVKRKLSLPEKAEVETTTNVDTFCIYCNEKCIEDALQEDWLPCAKCDRYAHESCCPIEPRKGKKKCKPTNFICDYCLY